MFIPYVLFHEVVGRSYVAALRWELSIFLANEAPETYITKQGIIGPYAHHPLHYFGEPGWISDSLETLFDRQPSI